MRTVIQRRWYDIEEVRTKNEETKFIINFHGFNWEMTTSEWKSCRNRNMRYMQSYMREVMHQAMNDIIFADKLHNVHAEIIEEPKQGYHKIYRNGELVGYRKYKSKRRVNRNGSRK